MGIWLTGLCVFLFAVPTEFTSVPFPVKALKIVVRDLLTGGESAAIGAIDDEEVASDDGVRRCFGAASLMLTSPAGR